MKKLFIFSDIHGFYDEWMTALDNAGFDRNNQDHILVSLGDLLDRGPDAVKCLQFINSIPEDRKICIIGNHELLMEDLINRGEPNTHDYHNGTVDTVEQLTGITGHETSALIEMHDNNLWNIYKKSWQWYDEVDDNIFVHGWIPCRKNTRFFNSPYEYIENWRDIPAYEFNRATWINGMHAWHDGVKEDNKTIWCGHWHTSWGHANLHNYGVEFVKQVETCYIDEKSGKQYPFAEYSPFVDDGIVAMDGCVVLTKKVNICVLEIE